MATAEITNLSATAEITSATVTEPTNRNWDATVDDISGRATYDDEAAGFAVLVADTGSGRAAVYIKNSATSADWSDPAYYTGPQGEKGDTGDAGADGNDGADGADGNGFAWRGDWALYTDYIINDVARHNDVSYVCVATHMADHNDEPGVGAGWDAKWDVFSHSDMLASIYDPNGHSADAFDMDNMDEGTDAKIMTAAERTKLGGLAAWDFEDRATAEAATVPAAVNILCVLSPLGGVLNYVRDASGDALTTNDGATWSPDGKIYPDHWAENTTPGTTDMTTAVQSAIDYGQPFYLKRVNYLVTDSLAIDKDVGCDIAGEMRTVPNSSEIPRITFNPPSSKKNVFVWAVEPTSYTYVGVKIKGVAVSGSGTYGADAVIDLPHLYRGIFDCFIFSDIDHYVSIENWLDCEVYGNVNGFRVSAVEITNSTLASSNITTRTIFDVYISNGDSGSTTYGYDIGTYSIINGKLNGIVETVNCAVRMAVGNTVDSTLYIENSPRSNSGAALEIGKIDDGAPGTAPTVFHHVGTNIHGTNGDPADFNTTLFADIDVCNAFSVTNADLKRFGALIATTSDSKCISFTNVYASNVTLLEYTSGINDHTQLAFTQFRSSGMEVNSQSMSSEQVPTTTNRTPQGSDYPRWAYDRIYSTASESFWVSSGDGSGDWHLLASRVYTGSKVLATQAISAGAYYQTTVTVTGALAGDFVQVSFGDLNTGLTVSGRVSAADTVNVTITNITGSLINTTAATIRVAVTKRLI